MRNRILTVWVGALLCAFSASAQEKHPVMGIWHGSFDGASSSRFIEGRLTPWGGSNYRGVFYVGDTRETAERIVIEGRAVGPVKDGIAEFSGDIEGGRTLTARVEGERLTGSISGRQDGSFTLHRVWITPPTLGQQPPDGAVVLMDGTSMDAWHVQPRWTVDGEGAAHIFGSSIVSKSEFGDALIHVEFRCPFMASSRGQARGNSGVYVQGRYEIQVLDSFGDPPRDNECGGIYQQAVPIVNASLPPEEWQTYDIDFRAPRFDENGVKTANARITVHHNGVLIHDDVELTDVTGGAISNEEATAGPILLQDHSDQVRFRNVWVQPKN
jgi:hypothetical protein